MAPRVASSRKMAIKFANRISRKRNNHQNGSHITKAQLIRQNRELQETLKCFMDQFEELRSLYLNVQSKFDLMKENNRDLAFKYACATHENELLKSRLDQISKEQFIKISSFKRDHNLFLQNLHDLKGQFNSFNERFNEVMDEITNHDPASIFQEEFEKTLSLSDISNLEELMLSRRKRSSGRSDELDRQTRVKEILNQIYCERIDLTAMSEEPSIITSSPAPSNLNNSTFSINSKKDESHCEDADNQLCSTLLEQTTNASMSETPSFRRIVPRTPLLNSTDADLSSPADKDSWMYNSEIYKATPKEAVLSTSLDSIQNFVPKTPKLTQPVANSSNCDSTTTNKSQVNRLSVAYPEQSPITSYCTRASRRLLDSTLSTRASSESNTNNLIDESKNDSTNEEKPIRRSKRARKNVQRVNINKM